MSPKIRDRAREREISLINSPDGSKGLFGSAISISTILKIAFLEIVFLKSSLFKIVQAFGKTC
jgi:hypothetical protein